MAATLAALAAAPVEVRIGGQPYRMSALRLRDQAEYERWVQERLCKLAGATASDADTLDKIVRSVCHVGYHSPEAARMIRTDEGAARLVWLGVRRNHPNLTFDQVMDAIAEDELLAAVDAYNRVNSEGLPAPKPQPPETTLPGEGMAA